MTTLSDLLTRVTRRLEAAGVPSAHVDASLLAQHALQFSRTDLILRAGEHLPGDAVARVEELARRREAREPLQHILGAVPFGDVMLRVTPAALIPRPETEVLLDLALRAVRHVRAPAVLDVGTGTGALALAIQHARPDATVHATDISDTALNLARGNATHLQLNVHFTLGDLHAGLRGPFHLIVSNPPYLPDGDAASAQPEVQHDPPGALYAGPDGLDVARRLVRTAPALLHASTAEGGPGVLALELDPRNVRVLASEMLGWETEVHADLTGRERFLLARPPRGQPR